MIKVKDSPPGIGLYRERSGDSVMEARPGLHGLTQEGSPNPRPNFPLSAKPGQFTPQGWLTLRPARTLDT